MDREKRAKEAKKKRSEVEKNVRYFCTKRGMNYLDIMEITGIPQRVFYNVVYEITYSEALLEKIAKALGVTTQELLSTKERKSIHEKKVYIVSNIRLLCMLNGINFHDISDITGVSLETIKKVANGKYAQNSQTLSLIAKALGVTKQELLYYDFTKGRKEKLGENLRKLRTAKKLSVNKLVDISYVGKTIIIRIEKKGELLKPDKLVKLADALNVTAEELLFGDF